MDNESQIEFTKIKFLEDRNYYPATRDQVVKLIILFKEAGIEDREERMSILREWTGLYGLKSSDELTLHTASVMIDHITNEDGDLTFDGVDFLNHLSFRA